MTNRSDTAYLLKLAHSRGIITEWPPLLTREKINRACLEYGRDGVVDYLRHEWTPERPTTNYCWVVSEVALRLVMPDVLPAGKLTLMVTADITGF